MSESSPELEEGATAESPTAKEDGQKSLLETLEAAAEGMEPKAEVEEVAEEQEESPPSEETAEAAEPTEGEEDKAEVQEEEPEPPFHKHPRWQQLKSKLTEAEARYQELSTTLEEKQGDLESYGRLKEFCAENDLANEDVDLAFEAMAAIKKGDSHRVLEILRPYYEQAAASTKPTLTRDLVERVEAGDITEETAEELARLRAQRQVAAAAAPKAPKIEVRPAPVDEETVRKTLTEAQAAVNAAERALLAKDPDYGVIKADVEEFFVAWLGKQKSVPSATETVKAFNQIVQRRKEVMRQFGGRSKSPVDGRPKAEGRPATKAPSKPKDDSLVSFLQHAIDTAE